MQGVPKTVLKGLQAAAQGPHPEADLLTAFAERSLADPERKNVLDHLARCAGCREVVALALPIPEDTVAAHRGNASWFSWPVLRWGVVAAGLAIITSIAILEYKGHNQPITVATNVMSTEQTAPATVTPPVMQNPATEQASSATPPAAVHKQRVAQGQTISRVAPAPPERKAFVSRNPAALPTPAPSRPGSAVAGGRYSAHIRSEEAGAAHNAYGAGSGGGIGSGSGGGMVSGVAPASPAQVHVQTEADQAATASTQENALEVVGKAKPAPKDELSSALVPNPDLQIMAGPMEKSALLRWTISATGALQRSLDGGATWQDVDVAAAELNSGKQMIAAKSSTEVSGAASEAKEGAAYGTAAKTAANAKLAPAKIAPTMKAASQPAPSAGPAVFRAVSVSSDATEVWAGGSGATLYHTTDAGTTWSRVVPSENGVALTGDVLSIQFSDARSGAVTTSTAETWMTLDDGQTWHKQ